MTTTNQRSFAAGEIAPALYSRVDMTKYATGLRRCRNFSVMRHGGVQNRAGLGFVCEVKDSTQAVRLIPFIFNADQTYMLEFGDLYMRPLKNGSHQYDLTLTITGVSNANPGVVTYTGTDPVAGQEVYISGITGAIGTYLNGRNFKLGTVDSGANTFQLLYLDGTNVNTTSMGAYTSDGTAKRVYTIDTPYVAADLAALDYAQSADVMTIVHPSYAPRDLSRTGDTAWALAVVSFAPTITAPTGVGNTAGAGTAYYYVVTSVDTDTGEESLASASTGTNVAPGSYNITWTNVTGAESYNIYQTLNGIYGFVGSAAATPFVTTSVVPDISDTPPTARDPFALETAVVITGITQANPAVVTTSTAHGFTTDDVVYISGVVGMTQVNGIYFRVTVLSTTTFSLRTMSNVAVNSTGYTAYASAGTAQGTENYPSSVTYFQQRRGFANTANSPEKIFLSRSGQYKNFTVSAPIQDDDAVTFSMVGRQVNEVRHLLELGSPVVMTSGGEWSVGGDSAGVITPGNINPKQQSYNGTSTLKPVLIGGNALYIQARGSVVRDLGFEFQADGYRGNDLTVFSAHMVDNFEFVDWTYQQIPHSIVWMVRDDGSLIGLTYVLAHQIVGWHEHDTLGDFENACAIPEGDEDFLYVVVNRTISGVAKRYIERMKTRFIDQDSIEDAVFVDSSLSYDGRNTAATTMTASGLSLSVTGVTQATTAVLTYTGTDPANGDTFSVASVGGMTQLNGNTYLVANVNTGANTFELWTAAGVPVNSTAYSAYTSGGTLTQEWTTNNLLTLTASGSQFLSTDVGNEIFMDDEDDGRVRFEIISFTSTTVVKARPNRTVPASLRTVAVTDWVDAVDEITGLWHLEGKQVSIFADGNVVANPNNDSYDVETVTNGSLTLDKPYGVIHIGLPYTSDIETLNIDTANGETLMDKKKLISRVSVSLEKSRGFFVGGHEPDADDDFSDMAEHRPRNNEDYDDPASLVTDVVDINIQPQWNSNGRVFIRQTDPVPLTILSVAASGQIPYK